MKNLLDHRLNEVSKITCSVSSIVSASGRYSISRCVAHIVPEAGDDVGQLRQIKNSS